MICGKPFVLTFVVVSGCSSVLAATSPTGLTCIDEMLLPSYGTIARKAAQPGTVLSRVRIGANGKPDSVRSSSPDPFLTKEVEIFLRYNTSFKSTCSGQTITLKFTFVMDKVEPTVNPGLNIKFRGPN